MAELRASINSAGARQGAQDFDRSADQISQAARRTGQDVDRLDQTIGDLGSGRGVAGLESLAGGFRGLGAAAAAAAAGIGGGEILQRIGEIERASVRLDIAQRNVGASFGYTRTQLESISREISGNSVRSVTELNNLLAQTVQFGGQLEGVDIGQFAQAVVGLTAITGEEDLAGVARGIRDAFSDLNEEGVTARQIFNSLRTDGVAVTEQEVAHLQAVIDTNDILQAKETLLQSILGLTRGAAEAEADTLPGVAAQIRNATDDLIGAFNTDPIKAFGEEIVDAMREPHPALIRLADEGIRITGGVGQSFLDTLRLIGLAPEGAASAGLGVAAGAYGARGILAPSLRTLTRLPGIVSAAAGAGLGEIGLTTAGALGASSLQGIAAAALPTYLGFLATREAFNYADILRTRNQLREQFGTEQAIPFALPTAPLPPPGLPPGYDPATGSVIPQRFQFSSGVAARAQADFAASQEVARLQAAGRAFPEFARQRGLGFALGAPGVNPFAQDIAPLRGQLGLGGPVEGSAELQALRASIDPEFAQTLRLGGIQQELQELADRNVPGAEQALMQFNDQMALTADNTLSGIETLAGFADVMLQASSSTDFFRTVAIGLINDLAQSYRGGTGFGGSIIGGLVAGIGGLGGAATGPISTNTINFSGGFAGAFQGGGFARRGQFALVGEAGPELVAFGRDAQVFSNRDSRAIAGGGMTLSFTFNIEGDADEEKIIRVFEDRVPQVIAQAQQSTRNSIMQDRSRPSSFSEF